MFKGKIQALLVSGIANVEYVVWSWDHSGKGLIVPFFAFIYIVIETDWHYWWAKDVLDHFQFFFPALVDMTFALISDY